MAFFLHYFFFMTGGLRGFLDLVAHAVSHCVSRVVKRAQDLPLSPGGISLPWGETAGVLDAADGMAINTNWGLALFDLDRSKREIQKYRKAIRANPTDPKGYYLWGCALADLCQYHEAVQKYKRAVELNPNFIEVYYAWGNVSEKMGQPGEAIEKYRKTIELSPQMAAAYERWRGAIDKLDTVSEKVEELKRCAMAYYSWGVSLDKQGRPYEAIEKYKRAVEVRPHYEAYHRWGAALSRLGKQAEACYYWGVALSFCGQPHSAIEQFKRAIEINPRMAVAYYGWGFTLGHLNKPQEAVEKFRMAMEINPYLLPSMPLPITGKTFQIDLGVARERSSPRREMPPRDYRPHIGIRNITGQDIFVTVIFEKVGEKTKKEEVAGVVEVGCQKLFVTQSSPPHPHRTDALYSACIQVSLSPERKEVFEEAVQYFVSVR